MEQANYCRTCNSSQQDSLVSIFQNNYNKMYFDLTRLSISEDDLYSKSICNVCIKELIHWDEFKKQCCTTLEKFYQEFVFLRESKDIIKTEPIEENPEHINVDVDTDFIIQDTLEIREELLEEIKTKTNKTKKFDEKAMKKFLKKNTIESVGQMILCNFEDCERRFDNPTRFKIHLKTHFRQKSKGIEQEKSDCKICNLTHHSIKDHEEHHLNNHESEPAASTSTNSLMCDICGKQLSSARSLRRHRETHNTEKSYKCEKCKYTAKTEHSVDEHMRRVHATDRPFSCEQCGKSFPFKTGLKLHMKAHSNIRNYQCQTCGKTFKTSYDLKVHQDTHNMHRPFVCDSCGLSFKSKQCLKKHSEVHREDRDPVHCDYCGKSFVSRRSMRPHILVHHSTARPFECNKCDMKFAMKTSLALHSKVHSDERDKVCNICLATFKHQASLFNHMKGHKKNLLIS